MRRGVIYVAYGRRAISAVRRSVKSLREHNNFPVVVVSDATELEIRGASVLRQPQPGQTSMQQSRQAKLSLLHYAPAKWGSILYLDADTEVMASLKGGFAILESGWDLALAPSMMQGVDAFRHVESIEVIHTMEALGGYRPLQLQAGVMFIRRSATTTRFFEEWKKEWARFKGQDQAALVRVLDNFPLRICLVGRDYNGGSLVEHHFGRAR